MAASGVEQVTDKNDIKSSITNTKSVEPAKFDLLSANPVYKPFRYPWAFEV